MVTRLENDIFDIMVEPSDWRYSAAIVGLSRYFEDRDKMEDEDYEVDEDCIKFCSDSITKEEFLLFAESYYGEEFPHVQVEEILSRKEFSKEMIDLVNKLLKENSIMKKVFSKKKFDGSNQEELLELIDENRLVLIRETFRNKKSMYANFATETPSANSSSIFHSAVPNAILPSVIFADTVIGTFILSLAGILR